MALVEEKSVVSQDGIEKSIDKDSMGMALDVLQRGLYAHPIESTVRELVSNAYDAVIERDVARDIIEGREKVEDHFDVTKKDGIYHASGWDPSYFDLKWLSKDPDVKVFYEEGAQKDTFRVVDNGVGIGKARMVGYFQLNYSSKRANKDSLGRFGLGSKVALSLGVDSFRVVTRYNGRKFKFDVYLDKVDSITSRFGANGKNDFVEMPTGRMIPVEGEFNEDGTQKEVAQMYKAYYEATDEPNGLELVVEVKKHNKQRFFDAVASQLMYMPKVKFFAKTTAQLTHKEVNIAAEVLYKDKDIIISSSNMYDKPHILLGTKDALINYGFVAFNELELEPKRGAVGLILDINDIEVTPSREAAIWSAKTREAVLNKYEAVKDTASRFVNDELKSATDYVEWMGKVYSTLNAIQNGRADSDSVIGKLASIIDRADIKDITFDKDPTIQFKDDVSKITPKGFSLRTVRYDKYSKKVIRDKATSASIFNLPIYISKSSTANPIRDRYLYESYGTFLLVTRQDDAIYNTHMKHIYNSPKTLDYNSIVVPQSHIDAYALSDMDDEDSVEVEKIDRAALRRQNAQIILHKAKYDYSNFTFSKHEITIANAMIMASTRKMIYTKYGDRDDMLTFLNGTPANVTSARTHFLKEEHREYFNKVMSPDTISYEGIESYLVSGDALKHVEENKAFTHLSDFLVKDVTDGKITFARELQVSATVELIHMLLENLVDLSAIAPYESSVSSMFATKNMQYLDKPLYEKHNMFRNCFGGEKVSNDPISLRPFFKECVQLHGMRLGVIPQDDALEESIKERLNWLVPESLCDKLKDVVIVDADILDVDLINNIMGDVSKYNDKLAVIWLFVNNYFRDDNVRDLVSAQLRKFIANDASVQQQDNTENGGQD